MSRTQPLRFGRRAVLPIVHAAEAAECGLACLTMIARANGMDTDLNALRQRFPMSLSGSTLGGIMGLADQLGFSARAVQADMDALPQLKLPAILHWDLNHFVVLKSVGRRFAVVHDPALGIRRHPIAAFSNHYTGVALELTPAADFSAVAERTTLKLSSLWSKMSGFWPAFLQILLLSALLQAVGFAMPFHLQLAIDEGMLRADNDIVLVLTLGFGGLVLIQALVEALRAWSLKLLGHMMSFQIAGNIVRQLMRLPSDWFEKRHVGDILSRVESGAAIQDLLTRGMIAAVIDGLMAVTAVIILFIYSPFLTLVVLGSVAASLLASLAFFPVLRARTEERIIEHAREQSHIMESVRAATTTKLMGREAEREGQWRNRYVKVVNASVSVGGYEIGLSTILNILGGLQTVGVVFLGARMVIAGDGMSVGMLIAFLSFRQTFSDRANGLVSQSMQFRFMSLHLDRLADIVTTRPDTDQPAIPLTDVAGGIRLDGVSFRYGAADRTVLDSVDLSIEPGEFVAISGPSGGGKTTLMRILLGLRAPTAGRVLLDGKLAHPGLWRSWREHVGVVAQDDQLLSGSIADNISFFDPDLDMDRVRNAAVLAMVDEDIQTMPMAYMSLIGDMGSVLSGGQRQRILLARALYRRPKILVLDEGTANLDMETEEKIVDLVARLPMTRIVVAHRPALLKRADRVLELRHGKLGIDMSLQTSLHLAAVGMRTA